MKIMYLNLCKQIFHNCFSMESESKFKINLYNEHFPEALNKYTRFPKFILLFSISYVRINREA